MLNPLAHRKILKNGTPGRAVVTAFTMPSRGASKQNIHMTLEVHAEGLSPYIVEDQWLVSSQDSLGFGMEVPVRVDRKDPERVAIDWKAARADRAAAKEARQEQLAAQPATGSASAFAASPAAGTTVDAQTAGGSGTPAAGGDDETIAKLERLAALRQSGALTEAEFEEQKRRLIGG